MSDDKITRLPVTPRLRAIDPDPPPRPIDVSEGDRPRVIISDTTALLLMAAWEQLANEQRLYVDSIDAAESYHRAFGELHRLAQRLRP